MASLVHNKNFGSSVFKANDSMTYEIPAFNQNLTEIFNGSHVRLIQPLSKKALQSPQLSHSFLSQSIGDPLYRQTHSQLYEITTLPLNRTQPVSPQISIANLYNTVDHGASQTHSRSPSIIPEVSLKVYKTSSPRAQVKTTLDTSAMGSSVYLYNKTNKSLRKKSEPHSKTTTIGEGDKFKQYLKYLDAMNDHAPKEKFERRLMEKYAKSSKKNIEVSESESPAYKNIPLPMLDKKFSVTSKDAPKSVAFLSRNSSIMNPRNTRFVIRNMSPADSQEESRNTINDARSLSPVSPLQNKKSIMVQNANRVFNFGLTKQMTRVMSKQSETDPLFSELAINMQDLYQLTNNEQKMISVLNKLAQDNPKVIAIISPKFHKVMDYDASKLEQKFAMIEVVTEALSIPMKLQKKKDGITLIEPMVVEELSELNKRIEEYNISKKKEQLKLVEDRLQQSQINLQAFRHKKLVNMSKTGKSFYGQPQEEKSINVSPTFSYDHDPMALVEEYQRNNGEFKHLSRKNIEHARGVNEVFNKWMSQQNEI